MVEVLDALLFDFQLLLPMTCMINFNKGKMNIKLHYYYDFSLTYTSLPLYLITYFSLISTSLLL